MATVKRATTANKAAEVSEKVAEAPAVKKFQDTDLITCTSITTGILAMIGVKSGTAYTWDTMGDVTDVEYRDLISAVRRKSPFVYAPRFIIQDEDFLSQHKDIADLYANLYSAGDLRQVLKLSPSQLRSAIKDMPYGAQDTLKTVAIMAIDDGSLDSVQRVKVLDEVLGTDMLARLTK